MKIFTVLFLSFFLQNYSQAQTIDAIFGITSNDQPLYVRGGELTDAKVHVCFYIWCLAQQQTAFTEDGGMFTLNMGFGNPSFLDVMVRPVAENSSSRWVILQPTDLIYRLTDTYTPNSTKLTWEAPTKHVDGRDLTISEFRLRYGNILVAPLADARIHVINNLLPGSYEFALSAVDTTNTEGGAIKITHEVK